MTFVCYRFLFVGSFSSVYSSFFWFGLVAGRLVILSFFMYFYYMNSIFCCSFLFLFYTFVRPFLFLGIFSNIDRSIARVCECAAHSVSYFTSKWTVRHRFKLFTSSAWYNQKTKRIRINETKPNKTKINICIASTRKQKPK